MPERQSAARRDGSVERADGPDRPGRDGPATGRSCIVCGATGLQLRQAIFPLKRVAALGVAITADAHTGELLSRSALPVETLGHGRGTVWVELRHLLRVQEVVFAFVQGGEWLELAHMAAAAGVPFVSDLEGLVQAVEALDARHVSRV